VRVVVRGVVESVPLSPGPRLTQPDGAQPQRVRHVLPPRDSATPRTTTRAGPPALGVTDSYATSKRPAAPMPPPMHMVHTT
jgi:hypothetical protein